MFCKLDMGVSGVAYASLIAEWTGFLIALWLTKEVFKNNIWKNKTSYF